MNSDVGCQVTKSPCKETYVMSRHSRYWVGALMLWGAGIGTSGCDALGTFLQPGVTVVIENATAFNAVPDLQTSNSRNIAEDPFAEGQPAASVTPIAPNQTATLRLDCDGELERITFSGARFQDAGGFGFGEANAGESWRRDVDFDCGDTIRIRLSGTVFFFDANVSIERAATGLIEDSSSSDGGGEDIGDLIDQLLGS